MPSKPTHLAEPYGLECILDVHEVDITFNRETLRLFYRDLCKLLDMIPEDLHFWDYDGDPEGYANAPPHLKGLSAVQFIRTSSIVIHTLDDLNRLYLNVFSCKHFDVVELKQFVCSRTGGRIVNFVTVSRI